MASSIQENLDFNLDLFLSLNEEYRSRPLVPQPRKFDNNSRIKQAYKRAAILDKKLDIRGKTVLEVGCGRGDLCFVLAKDYNCKVVGFDIKEYLEWQGLRLSQINLSVFDLTQEALEKWGQFDRIFSFSVWEHIKHPFSALKAAKKLLVPGGKLFISANLYRGPKASHRYREVFFPWPHLLFKEKVFEEFYRYLGMQPKKPAWVNKLTYAEYKRYFQLLDLMVEQEWLSSSPFDQDFYYRFEDILSRYPIFDLSTDFLNVVLTQSPTKAELSNDRNQFGEKYLQQIIRQKQQLEECQIQLQTTLNRLEEIETSKGYRLLTKLRHFLHLIRKSKMFINKK
jgi:SAM-dependent methyltransferase